MLKLNRVISKNAISSKFASLSIANSRCLSDKKIPNSADVVIIGGGSAGCHTLYYLAKKGVKAVLLERAKLTAGTTWHTAGLIWRLRPNDVDIQLLNRSVNLMKTLKDETEYDPGFIQNGGLFIAHNETRLKEYKRLSTIGNLLQIENQILTANEICEQINPLFNPKAFLGGLYSPGDGVVDPSMLCTSLTKEAIKNGARVIENCPVWDVLVGENALGHREVKGVQTPLGEIKTNCIVNTSGVWSRDIIEKYGITLPLAPMRHAYIVSEYIEKARNMPNVRDHDASIYLRIQGGAIGLGGYENNPILIDRVNNDFNFQLYDLDWSTFESHVKWIDDLCPAFSQAGVKSTVCGPESFTPDHKPIMGPDPRLDGLFHSCGYNAAGMMFGGGCGEQLAHWIIHGRPEFHMFRFDIRRFTSAQCSNSTWVVERSHEAYARNYSAVFTHDQPLAGRNFKKDSLHEIMINEGAFMEEKIGWERPGYFAKGEQASILPYDWQGYYGYKKHLKHRYEELLLGDLKYEKSAHHDLIGEEALNCRSNAALFNLNYFCKFFLHGPQAKEAAEWIFTADTKKDTNSVIYTCALNKFGGVESDLTVTVIESGNGEPHYPKFKDPAFYVVAGGASANHTIAHINDCIRNKSFQATVTDATDNIGNISIQGPKSAEILQQLTDYDLSANLNPYKSAVINLKLKGGNLLARILRISFVGELGYEIHIPMERCPDVYSALHDVGNKFKLRNAGYRSLYSLSCEKGYHLWDFDLRSDDTPVEGNLGFICRRKGNYLGKTTIDKQRTDGIKKRLVFLTLDEDVQIWGLEGVYRNGEPVGYLRRAEYGYTLDKYIGRAYISRPDGQQIDAKYLKTGQYEIDVLGNRYKATCHLTSPFDPQNQRILGIYK